MQHLDEGTIHAWLDGALDAADTARVEQHAGACGACAAAIAEARGLAAGASRILASLDNVPAGVIPRASATGESGLAARRSRSVWNTLHLTPARAAAAALVFVAAGAALVLQHKGDAPLPSPIVFATFDSTNRVKRTATETPAVASAPPTPMPVAGRPAQKAKPRTEVAMEAVAPTSSQRTSSDSISGATAQRLTTESANRAVAAAAPQPMAMDAAKSSLAAGAGGAPRAAALRSMDVTSARLNAVPARRSLMMTAGCYSVEGDSLPMLPRRIVLDTAGVVASVPSWRWSSRPGGINLEMMTPSAAAVQLDSVANSGDLRGALSLNGRQFTVLLRRVDCPAAR